MALISAGWSVSVMVAVAGGREVMAGLLVSWWLLLEVEK